MMRLNFDQVGIQFDEAATDSAMTHKLVLSTKVRRNERLK